MERVTRSDLSLNLKHPHDFWAGYILQCRAGYMHLKHNNGIVVITSNIACCVTHHHGFNLQSC